MALIKDGELAEDTWTHLDDEMPLDHHQKNTLSLSRWLSLTSEERQQGASLGVRLKPSDDILALQPTLDSIHLIVLEMEPFTDGRPFTQARDLRIRLGYSGELRVRGDFLRDQMFYLHRVGVNAFECAEAPDLKACQQALKEFSVTYQGALEPNDALYRQRINHPSL